MPRSIRTKRQRQLEEDYESVLKKRSRIDFNDREDPDEFDIDADFDYDREENMQNHVDVIHNENFQDDLRMLAVSNSTSFTFFDQQLVLLHSFLKSSIGEKQFFDLLKTCETVTKKNLPLDKASAKVLKKDLKQLWDIKCVVFCPNCHKILKNEGSKCDSKICKSNASTSNVIISTCDVRQQLLQILLKYYSFLQASRDNVIDISLTINTDGFVPKGHSIRELWPVYLQIADLPDHIKATHGSVALAALIVDNGKPSDGKMSDAEDIYTLDRAKEDIETLKENNKQIKKKLKNCNKTVSNLEEAVETLGSVAEENKQIKRRIKSVEKDMDKLKKEMDRFLPKKIPIAIEPEHMQAVETIEREFKLNDDDIRNYSASDFIKNEFLTSKCFAKVNRDLIEFIVAAVALFLQKEHIKDIDWTVTTSDKGKSKYKEFPPEFIQDICYLGMIGSGKNLEKSQWNNDENTEYNRAISQACSRLQTRLNKKRSDAKIAAAKRRRLEQQD